MGDGSKKKVTATDIEAVEEEADPGKAQPTQSALTYAY